MYFVIVRQNSGAGRYQLALTQRQEIEPTADTPLVLHGSLSDVVPYQQYIFRGRGGSTITATLSADGGTLHGTPSMVLTPTSRSTFAKFSASCARSGVAAISN